MKMELWVTGPASAKALAEFMPIWMEALREDVPQVKYFGEPIAQNTPTSHIEVPTEEEKPKRGRAAKPKAEEPAKEPEPAIRATPEDRQPEPVAEEPEAVAGEVVDDKVYTRQDVKDALAAYADKFGMAQAASEGVKLMGAPRISALPEDPAMFAAAVKALTEAVARG